MCTYMNIYKYTRGMCCVCTCCGAQGSEWGGEVCVCVRERETDREREREIERERERERGKEGES